VDVVVSATAAENDDSDVEGLAEAVLVSFLVTLSCSTVLDS